MFSFDEANKKGQEAMDTMLKSYSSLAKGMQAIATEAADYSKKSYEESVAHFERLTSAGSLEAVIELQASYVKNACESYVAEAMKIGEMYSDLATGTYKSYEAPVARAAAPAKAAAAA